MVERLVRNEKVRGSNPLTSSLRSRRSDKRRAVAPELSRRRTLLALAQKSCELRLRLPKNGNVHLLLRAAKRTRSEPILHQLLSGASSAFDKAQSR